MNQLSDNLGVLTHFKNTKEQKESELEEERQKCAKLQ